MISFSTFAKADRLREQFSKEAGGRFSVVYQALCAVSRKTRGNVLDARDVLTTIREILSRTPS